MVSSRIAGRRMYILGLGQSGQACLRWCIKQGAHVSAGDTREAILLDSIQQDFPDVRFYLGSDAFDLPDFNQIDDVVVSPGISPHHEKLQILQERHPHLSWIGELDLLAWALEDQKALNGYSPKVLGVTGTNGKTTVVSMLRGMFELEGYRVCAAGNISPSAIEALLSFEAQDYPEVWVLELSSFQLYRTESLHFDCACILNITPDHLDWHGSMEDYASSKLKLLDLSSVVWVDREDEYLKNHLDFNETHMRSFGLDLPCGNGDLGLLREETDWFSWVQEHSSLTQSATEEACWLSMMQKVRRIMPTQALCVQGDHNIKNAMAAMGMGYCMGLSWELMTQALRQYRAQPHRCVFVAQVRGVDFIDDSKGTNVGATVAALKGFHRSCAIILGGLSKGQNFDELVPLINRFAHTVVLIGQDKHLLNELFAKACSGVQRIDCLTLEQATREAFHACRSGEMVLLSPACASMDMFKNYHHRGEVFVNSVNEIAKSFEDTV